MAISASMKDYLYQKLKDYVINENFNAIVSIIIPCFNVENYVEKCLTSVIKQTFKDIEIICVNDGSTDSTLQILEAFKSIDSRIKIISQENGGLSCARNTGIDNSSGKYIAFLDSDDWISGDFIERLYNAITKNNADIAAGTIVRWRKNHQKYRVFYQEEKVYESLKDKINVCRIPKCCYVWNKLYKAECIKNYKFQNGVFFEDMLWTPNLLKNTKKLVTVPDIRYFYRVNSSSIVKKKPTDKKELDLYNANKYIINFFEENNLKLDKKYKEITKKIFYFLNIPIARIKTVKRWEVFYLFNLIPVFRYSKTKYRNFYNFFGLKFTIRKNKKSIKEIRTLNQKYEISENPEPKVVSRLETLEKLINTNCSMCRYGDGEFNLIWGENLPFQYYNKILAEKLKNILVNNDDNIIVCVPDIFGSMKHFTEKAADFWRKFLYYNREDIKNVLNLNKTYYDTEVTRPYIDVADKSICKKYFEDFKKVWQDKSIVIVEGEASRLGIGNDLFNNTKSIKRIICPAKDAFANYDKIFNECIKQPQDSLYVIALGPTATVLAYDLANTNRRALDLGHIDIEYEWFLMGATDKVPVKNKYVNESKKGKLITQLNDEEYLSQIIVNISQKEK